MITKRVCKTCKKAVGCVGDGAGGLNFKRHRSKRRCPGAAGEDCRGSWRKVTNEAAPKTERAK